MIWFLIAGLLAGFAVGFIGAGAAVIGLPFLLYIEKMSPTTALGTNALGVAFTIIVILLYRIFRKDVYIKSGLIFAIPGLAGVYIGTLLSRLLPGKEIIFLLGFLLFAVAGWMYYLSVKMGSTDEGSRDSDPSNISNKKLIRLGFCGFGVGLACGFFAIGGGFMIIPGIMLAADFSLLDAIATGLLPFGLFSLWIGGEYWINDSAQVLPAFYIMTTGILGGISGIWLSRHISKRKMQRMFAVFMLGLGVYMILQ